MKACKLSKNVVPKFKGIPVYDAKAMYLINALEGEPLSILIKEYRPQTAFPKGIGDVRCKNRSRSPPKSKSTPNSRPQSSVKSAHNLHLHG